MKAVKVRWKSKHCFFSSCHRETPQQAQYIWLCYINRNKEGSGYGMIRGNITMTSLTSWKRIQYDLCQKCLRKWTIWHDIIIIIMNSSQRVNHLKRPKLYKCLDIVFVTRDGLAVSDNCLFIKYSWRGAVTIWATLTFSWVTHGGRSPGAACHWSRGSLCAVLWSSCCLCEGCDGCRLL